MEFCGFDKLCWANFIDYFFIKSFVIELLATFIGAGLGVLTAIGLRNWFDSRTEKKKKKKILSLLRVELKHNESEIKERRGLISEGDHILEMSSRLKVESWRAFSDGGELEWIKDLELLDTISNAYYEIRSLRYISDKVAEYKVGIVNPQYFSQYKSHLISFVTFAIHNTDEIFKEVFPLIDKHLE